MSTYNPPFGQSTRVSSEGAALQEAPGKEDVYSFAHVFFPKKNVWHCRVPPFVIQQNGNDNTTLQMSSGIGWFRKIQNQTKTHLMQASRSALKKKQTNGKKTVHKFMPKERKNRKQSEKTSIYCRPERNNMLAENARFSPRKVWDSKVKKKRGKEKSSMVFENRQNDPFWVTNSGATPWTKNCNLILLKNKKRSNCAEVLLCGNPVVASA